MYYFTVPIHEVKISESASGEVKMLRESRTDRGYAGTNAGTFEGCYVGIDKTLPHRAEMSPGDEYRIKISVYTNYYGYNGTDYCMYNYTNTYNIRVFLDLNIDGVFQEGEWLNSPQNVAAGKFIKVGTITYQGGNYNDWKYNASASCYTGPASEKVHEWRYKVPDDQKMGTTRMRILSSYYYPYNIGSAGTPITDLMDARSACWNGYAYDYTAYYGGWYGYNYGEIEDYLIDFTLSIKGTFPDNKAPDDILLANETYNGTTRNISGIPTEFKKPMVKFGGPQKVGTLMQFRVVGPLPASDIVYEALDPITGSTNINVGQDKITLPADLVYKIQSSRGPASDGSAGNFKQPNGGEFKLVVVIKKDAADPGKMIQKNFIVSWENDLAAIDIKNPLTNGEPRYFKYRRGLNISFQGEVQNVGLRAVAKFTAYMDVYNSKGEMVKQFIKNFDTADGSLVIIMPKEKRTIDFGNSAFSNPDVYKTVFRIVLKSATDLEPYNDRFPREDSPYGFAFEIRDEIQAAANSIDIPAGNSTIIAGRPFRPTVTLRNEGVSDISDCPTKITIEELPSGIKIERNMNVQDIPQGRYNLKSVAFPPELLDKPGNYKMTLRISHPDDLVKGDDTLTIFFTVVPGITGNYTVGTAKLGQARNFPSIDSVMNALYKYGVAGSTTFEFTDAVYNVNAKSFDAPAWDMSTTILGLGYDATSGTYRTLTFKPSAERAVSRGSVTINLIGGNGKGILLGQSLRCTNPYSVQLENTDNSYFSKFSNSAGYITFDGGANKSLKFMLNPGSAAHGAVFYLNSGSQNITIKNVLMDNGKPSIKNSVWIPNTTFSIVDGFFFQSDTLLLETGVQSYSAGIVNRVKVESKIEGIQQIKLDTLVNKNNKFHNNEINGFGWGVISLGIGPLRNAAKQDYDPYYNSGIEIIGNVISNVSGGGVFLGHEDGTKVNRNTIYGISGVGGVASTGIQIGGNGNKDYFGYNNVNIEVSGNTINDLTGKDYAYGIKVEQAQNRYPQGSSFRYFPHKNDKVSIISNAVWNIKGSKATTLRAGIHVFTERNHEVADLLTRMITPKVSTFMMKEISLSNNTIMIGEDNQNTTGLVAGIGLQQTTNARMYNNAISITDKTISDASEVAAGVFVHGPTTGTVTADYNVYWFGTSNVAAYRHVYADTKSKIIEMGTRNEYMKLGQWQMESKNELNSTSARDFTSDIVFTGQSPETMNVKSTIIGSVLAQRGERLPEVLSDIYGNVRGVAGSRYDVGAIEFNGNLFNNDAEVLTITSPGQYRATAGTFSDAEYIMTTAPVEVKGIVRNSGNFEFANKKFTVNIYRENPTGGYSQVLTETITLNLAPTINNEIKFNLANGMGTEFVPQTYSDLSGYSVAPQFVGMTANVTPLYKIEIVSESDEFNVNNKTEKYVRFFVRRSPIMLGVTAQEYVDLTSAGLTADKLAAGLNQKAVVDGLKKLNWVVDESKKRYDYDVFYRAGWEPRAVNYTIYRTLVYGDGDDKTMPRLAKNDLATYLNTGVVDDKKNLVIGSQEMVRNNPAVDSDDKYLSDVLRSANRFPGNPLGAGAFYTGKQLKGIAVSRDFIHDVISTGVAGDKESQPGLFNIVNGEGISRIAMRYQSVTNPDWPDEARIAGVATTTLERNVVYLGLDWRHFGNMERALRGTMDFFEGNGGVVVPTELLSFDATKTGKRVDVSWSTASELSSARFEVERANLVNEVKSEFTKIGEIAAAGKSSIIKYYGPVVDNKVEYGNSYVYRLKMVDLDGSSSYSNEKVVTMDGLEGIAFLDEVTPNPVMNISTLSYKLSNTMNVSVVMYDMNGKEVANLASGTKAAGNYDLTINSKDFPAGTYTVVLTSGEIILTKQVKIVK